MQKNITEILTNYLTYDCHINIQLFCTQDVSKPVKAVKFNIQLHIIQSDCCNIFTGILPD